MKYLPLILTTTLVASPLNSLAMKVESGHYNLEKNLSFKLTFETPIIGKEYVGKPAVDGLVSVAPALSFKSEWLSPTELEITLQEDPHPRQSYQISVNTPTGVQQGTIRSRGEMDLSHDWNSEPFYPIFFRTSELGLWEQPFKTAIASAYYRSTKKDENIRVPAKIRQATVADALMYKDIAEDRFIRMDDEEWAEFAKLPPTQLVPHLWLAEPYDYKAAGSTSPMELLLPGLGDYNEKAQAYGDLRAGRVFFPTRGYSIENSHIDSGLYKVTLSFETPVMISQSLEQLLPSITWLQNFPGGEVYDFSPSGKLSYKSTVEEETEDEDEDDLDDPLDAYIDDDVMQAMEVTLNVEETNKLRKQTTLPTGEKKDVLTGMVFTVKKGLARSSLTAIVELETLAGPMDKPKTKKSVTTRLAPERPHLATDIMLSSLTLTGKREFEVNYGLLANPRVRVLQYDNRGATPARVIAAFENYYSEYGSKYKKNQKRASKSHAARAIAHQSYESRDNEGSSKQVHSLVPTELLGPIQERTLDLPSGTDELTLSLKDKPLYPNTGAGLYIVEISGEALPDINKYWKESDESTPLVVTQGLVQVTDLGLLWKSDFAKRKIFLYGYRLSTGKELEKARISFYSADAKLLHEQDISPAGSTVDLASVIGDKASDVAYLHLSTKDDAYTVAFEPEEQDEYTDNSYYERPDFDMENFPYVLASLFTDRPLYRPGETVHVKGFLRQLQRNKLSIPTPDYISSLNATLCKSGNEISKHEIKLEKDGSFALSVTIPDDADEVGRYSLNLETVNPSDRSYTSPDMKALGITSRKSYSDMMARDSSIIYGSLEGNRQFLLTIPVQHFRRNEFELKDDLGVSPDGSIVTMMVDAQQFSGAPVAGGKARWSLVAVDTNLYPEGLKDYRFGDYREEDMGYYNTYFWLQPDEAEGERHAVYNQSVLDADGKGTVSLPRPQGSFPRRQKITSSVTVTNGNEQSLSAGSTMMVDPADLYIGLRQPEAHSQASAEGIKLDLLSVNNKGIATAAPGPITIEVNRETSNPYRYGSLMHQMLRFSPENEVLPSQTVFLDAHGAGSVRVPATKPGVYTITASGKDATGRDFRSAIKHYVWGKTERGSVWERPNENEIALITDQDSYKVGDKVRLLLQTPFDGEVLLSLQREGILRQIRQRVSKDKPVIEFTVEAGDAPQMMAEVILINGIKDSKESTVKILTGKAKINIDPADQRLKVALDLPQQSVLPGETCEVSGQVLNAKGTPAAHASVVLYAEDEGTLQAGGFTMPNPLEKFYGWRPYAVSSYSSLGQLLSENTRWREYGNKGIFIGGGDDGEYFGSANAAGKPNTSIKLRENFAPCALWLGHVVTDAEGRFKTPVTNPDTLTRYRVIAVAAHGAEQFGTGTGHYQVNKPIMLEPSAPLSACKGDLVQVPVTLTMLPEELPAAIRAQKDVSWKVQLQASSTAQVINPVQTITLNSNAPTTIPFTVNMRETGPVRFEWRVEPVTPMGDKPQRFTDGVAEQFVIRPATPFLRESLFVVLDPNTQAHAKNWLKMDYDEAQTRLNLTLSPSPLSPYVKSVAMLQDYPYGCTEQLSSRSVPYIFAEAFHRAAGTKLELQTKRQRVLEQLVTEIMKRRIGNSATFSYWTGESEPSEFSAYAYHVLSLAAKQGKLSPAAVRSLEATIPSIIRSLLVEKAPDGKEDTVRCNPLWIYSLATQGKLTSSMLHQIFSKRQGDWTSPQELWLVALVAQIVSPETASVYVMNAENAAPSDNVVNYSLPSVEVIKQMLTIVAMPESDITATGMLELVHKHASKLYNNTLDNAWMGIMIADYITRAKLEEKKAQLNGKEITPTTPLSYAKSALAALPAFQVGAGGKVYVSGTAEGFLKKEQPDQLVDKGFHVQRRYEKLLADGTWQPTAEFKVGDIVRISVTAKSSQTSRYVALEDYLPAGMEAVNPDVPGQLLPDAIMRDKERSWYSSSWITRKEFLKDRVRFFVTHWSHNDTMEAHYIARVTKAGIMKAPAAKAEEMYKPQIYGLAQPLNITINP